MGKPLIGQKAIAEFFGVKSWEQAEEYFFQGAPIAIIRGGYYADADMLAEWWQSYFKERLNVVRRATMSKPISKRKFTRSTS